MKWLINLNFGFFRLLGCVKASGLENRKQVNIKNMDLLAIYRSARAFALTQKAKKTKIQVIIASMLLCTSCGYHVGESGSLVAYRSISVPYVEGDLRGELTAALIRELATTGGFDYYPDGGSLLLKVSLIEVREDNVGFRYYRNQQGRQTHSVIPTETRLKAIAEVTVIENASNSILVGPVSITASIDFDHDYYSSRNAVNIYSLGQVTDYDAAYETAFRPLNFALARKIADYLKDCW